MNGLASAVATVQVLDMASQIKMQQTQISLYFSLNFKIVYECILFTSRQEGSVEQMKRR